MIWIMSILVLALFLLVFNRFSIEAITFAVVMLLSASAISGLLHIMALDGTTSLSIATEAEYDSHVEYIDPAPLVIDDASTIYIKRFTDNYNDEKYTFFIKTARGVEEKTVYGKDVEIIYIAEDAAPRIECIYKDTNIKVTHVANFWTSLVPFVKNTYNIGDVYKTYSTPDKYNIFIPATLVEEES